MTNPRTRTTAPLPVPPPPRDRNGKAGGAMAFNGTSSRINIPYSSVYDQGQPNITLSAWVNPAQLGASTYAVVNRNSPYLLWVDGSNKRVYTGLNKASWYWAGSDNNSLSVDAWQYIVMTYNGASRKIYINGKQNGNDDTQISGNISTNANGIAIGYDHCCSRYYFNGSIDDVRIYNKALSPVEVKQLYEFN